MRFFYVGSFHRFWETSVFKLGVIGKCRFLMPKSIGKCRFLMTKSIGKWRTETKEEDDFTDAIGFIWKLVTILHFWRHCPKKNNEQGFPLKGALKESISPSYTGRNWRETKFSFLGTRHKNAFRDGRPKEGWCRKNHRSYGEISWVC